MYNFTEDKGGWSYLDSATDLLKPLPEEVGAVVNVQPSSLVPSTSGVKRKKAETPTSVVVMIGEKASENAMNVVEKLSSERKDVTVLRTREFILQKDWATALLPKGLQKAAANTAVIAIEALTSDPAANLHEVLGLVVASCPGITKEDYFISESDDKAKAMAQNVWTEWKDVV